MNNNLKTEFRKLPKGIWFTGGSHNYHYIKVEEIKVQSHIKAKKYIVNAVVLEGTDAGTFEFFSPDEEVYWGKI